MYDRRRKSKILPILFLFLQIIAFLVVSYLLYLLLIEMGVSTTLVFVDIF
ncbi:hypothetical protein [Sulfurimonas autotrophica]|uniref:Uncharacterized protein n=1 Tax=Sulfurimonas autotrophica (strain ATCC BAA-671 / DSM 16294 / JCM 11897 / OK10) TaxID=563040 RepID=E0US63_SULAO|nr:hypothetical protein [Sulfurimonas autotrophica]ADN10156.1 hypothetical protein Saut_2114 [Sulfurimonas autotrophica DSM 16294]